MTRKFVGDRLLVATHNKGKLAEITEILAPHGVSVVGAGDMDLPEPEETEDTFVGNARIKAHAAAKATSLPALADDSGLSIDALNGAPGVYTADWAETPNGRDFMLAMTRANDEINAVGPDAPRTAQFRCTLVLAWPDGHDEVFEGVMAGSLTWPIRGEGGFGYDPMFVPEGLDVTCAEMGKTEKNKISHRGRALQAFMAGCFG